MQIASMRQVVFGYSDIPCLEDVDVHLDAGEFVAVTGPNGAAKTTLLKLLLGLLQPWQGTVHWYGRPTADAVAADRVPAAASGGRSGRKSGKPSIAYVPQQIAAFNSGFPSQVGEFVRSGRFASGSWIRRTTPRDHEAAETALRQVGMWALRHRKIGELSGGQKQRVCIARALASEPDVLVLDEPATGMDVESRTGLFRLLHHHVREAGMTVLMVTHGLEEVQPYLDRVIELVRKEGGWKCCTTTSCSGHFVPASS